MRCVFPSLYEHRSRSGSPQAVMYLIDYSCCYQILTVLNTGRKDQKKENNKKCEKLAICGGGAFFIFCSALVRKWCWNNGNLGTNNKYNILITIPIENYLENYLGNHAGSHSNAGAAHGC